MCCNTFLPFAPIDENFAGIEVDIPDLDEDEFVHAYSGIEEQFEQDLVLHIAALLDGSEEPFQIGRHLAKILWDFTYLCWANPPRGAAVCEETYAERL